MATIRRDVDFREWLEPDNLMLLEAWARDGYTNSDIANRIGIKPGTLGIWKTRYPEIKAALSKGKEVVDYKVENAMLKSALGYKTKDVKVTTIMRGGEVIETHKEVTTREQAPNVAAAQTWLFNRLPEKWKRNRDNIIESDDDETKIHVTVIRPNKSDFDNSSDEEWKAEINSDIEIRSATKQQAKEARKAKESSKKQKSNSLKTKVENDENDKDYWPDDWVEE